MSHTNPQRPGKSLDTAYPGCSNVTVALFCGTVLLQTTLMGVLFIVLYTWN